jgi:hypothetical protein
VVKIRKKVLRYSALALLFALLAAGFCHAEGQNLSVIIKPVGKDVPVKAYPYEVVYYDLVVINNDTNSVGEIDLRVRADQGLAIVVNGKEMDERRFFIRELLPDETRVLEFLVKPLIMTGKRLNVYVDYGTGGELTYTNSTNIEMSEPEVTITGRLSKTAVNPEEEASLFLDIKNNGQEKVTDVSIALEAEEGLTVKDHEYNLESLDPNQAFTNKEFLFSVDTGVEGKKDMVLRVSYTDRNGRHVFEKVYFVDVRGRFIYFIAIIVAIIILAAASYAIKKKTTKKEISKDIEVREIEAK